MAIRVKRMPDHEPRTLADVGGRRVQAAKVHQQDVAGLSRRLERDDTRHGSTVLRHTIGAKSDGHED